MVNTEQKVALTQQEEATFVHSKSTTSSLATYWAVPLLCPCAESAPHIHCLPSCVATAWPKLPLTLAPLLAEPEPHGHLRPICGKSCREGRIEAADTFLTLPHHLLF